MVDEFSLDRTGWARFSLDRTRRYRLARSLVPGAFLAVKPDHTVTFTMEEAQRHELVRVVFLMINPSTADAFKPDRTVAKCCLFAQKWGAHIIEVVNLFTLVSPYPTDLDLAYAKAPELERRAAVGMDIDANREILSACIGAKRVIAAWGNNGSRWARDIEIMQMMQRWHVTMECLGETGELHPLHPLARGKMFIPLDREPIRFPIDEGE